VRKAGLDLESEHAFELGLDEADDDDALRALVAKKLRVPVAELPPVELKKRSIDARRGKVSFHVVVGFAEEAPIDLAAPNPVDVRPSPRVVIIGAGPAGLYCAYQLARSGIASLIVERGKKVQPRRHDLAGMNQRGEVNPESNYCFGEGGAGTYSDGKLYTRSHKRGDVRDVLEVLALHGAPSDILTDARPHIGSNRLPKVVTGIRERLESVGVEVLFEARVVDLITTTRGAAKLVSGVRLADGRELGADAVVVAGSLGARSARDAREARRRARSEAVRARRAHRAPAAAHQPHPIRAPRRSPEAAVGCLQARAYGRGARRVLVLHVPGRLGRARLDRRGRLVVNGMSLSRRDSPYANSGLVVSVELGDLEALGLRGPRAGVELQARVEEAAWQAGGGALKAPATRVTDFLEKRGSSTVPGSSYLPGVVGADVAEVLDASGLRFADRLREALRAFGRNMRGYVTDEAILIATESRTSSPVRVPRDPESLEAPDLGGLFPCGEGAGYAGGIVSAALDGMRVARAVEARLAERGAISVTTAPAQRD
jgi:uncharacterized protein